MKLTLGTVQFGLDYGVSNNTGKVPDKEVHAILTSAISHGITTLDCAAAYGTSEQLIGDDPLSKKFTLVTKIPACTEKKINIASLLEQSLTKLKRDKIDTLLLHNADDLITNPQRDEIYQQLSNIKKQGLVNKIGVSVYTPAQLQEIIKNVAIDAVQVPINVLDQRFLQGDFLKKLQDKNIIVHCRSVFLQGLLLMEPSQVPSYFLPYQNILQAFAQLANQLTCSKLTLALAIVAQNSLINNIVIGCCSKKQLDEIVVSYQQAKKLNLPQLFFEQLASEDVSLINPSLWCVND